MLTISTPPYRPLQSQQACYFSLEVPSNSHFSTETPCCSPFLSPEHTAADPTNPLLAVREPCFLSQPSPTSTTFSSVLQMQTAAAHGRSPRSPKSPRLHSRPQPVPVQNVLHVTSNDFANSTGSIDSSKSSFDLARCSRCQRTPSADIMTGRSNMVQYGLNLWYCNRCAGMVGLSKR